MTRIETFSPDKTFEIWNSPKSYRYKEEAITNHAPQTPGMFSPPDTYRYMAMPR